MTALVAKNLLDGTKAPATTTSEMKTGLGSLRDFLAESLGTEGTTAFSKSLTGNGYQKFPSGLILQWGSGTTSAAGGVFVTFPIAFPSGILQASVSNTSSSPAAIALGWQPSAANPLTQMAVWASGTVSASFSYIVVGY